jgi:hypothetical protein
MTRGGERCIPREKVQYGVPTINDDTVPPSATTTCPFSTCAQQERACGGGSVVIRANVQCTYRPATVSFQCTTTNARGGGRVKYKTTERTMTATTRDERVFPKCATVTAPVVVARGGVQASEGVGANPLRRHSISLKRRRIRTPMTNLPAHVLEWSVEDGALEIGPSVAARKEANPPSHSASHWNDVLRHFAR